MCLREKNTTLVYGSLMRRDLFERAFVCLLEDKSHSRFVNENDHIEIHIWRYIDI